MSPLLGVSDPSTIRQAMGPAADREPAKAAAEQFEAVLVRQLLGSALKPMLGGQGEQQAPGSDIYQYMITDVVSQSVTQGGGLGIAKMLASHMGTKPVSPKHT
jgi:Rod binding domain-containing protein